MASRFPPVRACSSPTARRTVTTAKFADPDRFDIERSNASEHLGLGYGAHSCPGGHLARMELRALLDALLPRVERFEIQSVTRKLNNVIRGLDTCIVEAVRA
jgi:cytochrome P450